MGSLENEPDPLAPLVLEELAEGLSADVALADQHVAIAVRAEASRAVVQVEARRRLAGRFLEPVEHLAEGR